MRTIVVANCKGGVGKTFVAANLAQALADQGTTVALFDLDVQVPSLDLFFVAEGADGQAEKVTVGDRLTLHVGHVEDGTGTEVAEFDFKERSGPAEVAIVDLGPGMSPSARAALAQATDVLLVLTPDPASLLGALRAARCAKTACPHARLGFVVNQATTSTVARNVGVRFQSALGRFLSAEASELGWIARDAKVPECAAKRRLVVDHYPRSAAARGITRLVENLPEAAEPAVELQILRALRETPVPVVQDAA